MPSCADDREPNEQPGSGPVLIIDQAITGLTFYPMGDADFFLLWGKGGRFYQISTTTGEGVDTRVSIFDPTGKLIAENDDYTPGNPASQVTFMALGEGWFAVKVDSRAPIDWGCREYTISAIDVSPPTVTPTATPGPSATATRTPSATPPATAIPDEAMYDEYEPNYDFQTAANIGVGQTIELNFNPYPAGSNAVDVDFFRLYVKVGDRLQIETTNLAEGLDTNLILYRDSGELIGGNDDCEPGERRSCLEWSPDYTGLAYIMIGPVGTIPEAIGSGSRAYSLTIKNLTGETTDGSITTSSLGAGTPPAPGKSLPWAVTPLPATPTAPLTGTTAATMPLVATPTPAPPAVVVRPFSLASPTPTPRLETVTIQLSIYYDQNNNRAPDMAEGVAGVSVRVLDGLSNRELGQTFTDARGYAMLAVPAGGVVRASVSYLGYNETVKPPGKELSIRLNALTLPSIIP